MQAAWGPTPVTRCVIMAGWAGCWRFLLVVCCAPAPNCVCSRRLRVGVVAAAPESRVCGACLWSQDIRSEAGGGAPLRTNHNAKQNSRVVGWAAALAAATGDVGAAGHWKPRHGTKSDNGTGEEAVTPGGESSFLSPARPGPDAVGANNACHNNNMIGEEEGDSAEEDDQYAMSRGGIKSAPGSQLAGRERGASVAVPKGNLLKPLPEGVAARRNSSCFDPNARAKSAGLLKDSNAQQQRRGSVLTSVGSAAGAAAAAAKARGSSVAFAASGAVFKVSRGASVAGSGGDALASFAAGPGRRH